MKRIWINVTHLALYECCLTFLQCLVFLCLWVTILNLSGSVSGISSFFDLKDTEEVSVCSCFVLGIVIFHFTCFSFSESRHVCSL